MEERPSEMFQKEQLALIHRWSKAHGGESDMSEEEILESIELALSTWFNRIMICFEPDDSGMPPWDE